MSDQIHPGYVLKESVKERPQLSPGRVLTPDDVEDLKKITPPVEIEVIIIDKSSPEKDLLKPGETKRDVKRKLQNLEAGTLSKEEKARAIFDINLDSQLQKEIERRKNSIRGVDYQLELEAYHQKHLQKYEQELSQVQPHTREESLKAIRHHAQSKLDFEKIATLEALERPELIQKYKKYIEMTQAFMDAIITQRVVYISFVESMVLDLIQDVGYKLSRALFALSMQEQDKYKFMVSHSLLVLIIALVTAIELTALSNEKSESLSDVNINTLLALSKKSFHLEELINLGVAALLHDINLYKDFPDMKKDFSFDLSQESRIDLHPSHGYHMAQSLNIDFEVQRSIFQHHERFDGSGFPNGATMRIFTKYTPLIMFAEYYIESTTENPFVSDFVTPRKVVVDLLSKQREQFDGDVIYAFLRAASLFPIGSWVKLSNHNVGIVTKVNNADLSAPVVVEVFDEHMQALGCRELDLCQSDIKIVHPIRVDTIRKLNKQGMQCLMQY